MTVRVLLIPSSDYTGHPFPQRYHHLFERLNNTTEFEVHVVRFPIYKTHRRETKLEVHEFATEIRCKKLPLYYFLNMPFHGTAIRSLVRREKIDIVAMANLAPPFAYKIIQQLARDNTPTLFDVQDYFPTSAAGFFFGSGSFGTREKLVRSGLHPFLKYLVSHATCVTAASQALANLSSKLGAKKVIYLPNGISERFLDQYDGTEIREKLEYSETDIVIGYIGSMEFWLDMLTLIRGVRLAKDQGKHVKLMLIGGNLQTDYSKQVLKWLEKVKDITTWLNFVPFDVVPHYIAAMNFGTMPYDPEITYYAGPVKLWEYLSQGLPTLAAPIPETILHKSYLHIVRTPEDYSRIIAKYDQNPKPFIERALEGKKHSIEQTWGHQSLKLSAILKSLMNSN